MGAFLEQYGIAIFVLIIIGIMVLMASGVGATVEGLITQEVKRFTDKTVSENSKIISETDSEKNEYGFYFNKEYISRNTTEEIANGEIPGGIVIFYEDGSAMVKFLDEDDNVIAEFPQPAGTFQYENNKIIEIENPDSGFIVKNNGKILDELSSYGDGTVVDTWTLVR